MDATTMPSTSSLILKLQQDFPDITFVEDDMFSWSPTTNTVHYDLAEANAAQLLIHELSHGLLGHHTYKRDVELLAMETEAWTKAKELASTYNITLVDDTIEDHLDTYREWLHARSTCPACKATGYQVTATTYECPACTHGWRVNEARICALRRYSIKK